MLKYTMRSDVIFVVRYIYSILILDVSSTIERCRENCGSSDRLTGPTRMDFVGHPLKITSFPTKNTALCKLGCTYYFTEYNTVTSCKRACDFSYRYKVTAGYSDRATEAELNCRDGCDIAN